jgi:carboxyl-terminal processing protease
VNHPEPLYNDSAPADAPHPKRRLGKSLKIICGLIVLVVIFNLGVGVGSGRIKLGGQLSLNKPVSTNLPENLDYSSVEQVYDTLKADYDGQLEHSKLLDGLKAGLAEATGDPYTVYLNAKEAKEFSDQLNGTFTGIGAELGKDDKGNLIVISPIAGFPAEKAGLKAKDIIAQIDGKATSGESIEEAVTKIRGEKGTKVTLDIIRDNTKQVKIEIVRDQITIASVKSEILEGNIGYLQISRFSEDTVSLATKAAQDFKDRNVKGVILDVRSDPGGLLDASIGVSSLWLPRDKNVLTERRGDKVIKNYPSTGNAILAGVPTVVLIDGGSASASEITAGALRDNKAATLIGVKSYGKGSVQQIINLGDGSELKVTIAHWFTPNGKTIDKTGIEPDKEVKVSDEDIKNKNDTQKQAAIEFLKK